MSAFLDRISKVRELASAKGLEAVVIRRNPNLAWAIGGRVHVPLTTDAACFDLIIYEDRVVAITNAIEAPRLIAEEFPSEIDVQVIDWWQGRDGKLPTGPKIGCDQPGSDRLDLTKEVELIRQSLVAEDVDRMRSVSVDSAIALGEALKECTDLDREIDVTARIANALWHRNLELVFIGVAGAERVRKYRHPLPTENVVGNRIVASICARRKGLIASVTRIVAFNNEEISSFKNLLQVEAALLDVTRVGAKFSEPIEAAILAYPKFGFASDEWTNHHQGGPTGYAPRDWPANRESAQSILNNQPIAWNPTADGWKCEDTILATSTGVEIMSVDPNWPVLQIAGRARPDILRK